MNNKKQKAASGFPPARARAEISPSPSKRPRFPTVRKNPFRHQQPGP